MKFSCETSVDFNGLHGVISGNTGLLIVTAVAGFMPSAEKGQHHVPAVSPEVGTSMLDFCSLSNG
jgi:hypothetical protein